MLTAHNATATTSRIATTITSTQQPSLSPEDLEAVASMVADKLKELPASAAGPEAATPHASHWIQTRLVLASRQRNWKQGYSPHIWQ